MPLVYSKHKLTITGMATEIIHCTTPQLHIMVFKDHIRSKVLQFLKIFIHSPCQHFFNFLDMRTPHPPS